MIQSSDTFFLRRCFELAKEAQIQGLRPFGAVMVYQGQVVAEAASSQESLNDPTAHPEIIVIRQFGRHLGRQAYPYATLYTNIEPCPMCAGAVFYATLGRLVFSVSRERFDYIVSKQRGRPRRHYQGCRAIVDDLGHTEIVGPLIEQEGVNLIDPAALNRLQLVGMRDQYVNS